MIKSLIISVIAGLSSIIPSQKPYTVTSPDGKISAVVSVGTTVSINVSADGSTILALDNIGMELSTGSCGYNEKIRSAKKGSADEAIKPVVPLKNATVRNHYNSLTLGLKSGMSIELRVFDEGFAYRLFTSEKDSINVIGENLTLGFPSDYTLHLQQTAGDISSQEEPYTHVKSSELKATDNHSHLPILVESKTGRKVLFCETGLLDYPGMFVRGNGKGGLRAEFPKDPAAFHVIGCTQTIMDSENPYIARTAGKRSYPWRYFVVTREDGDLVTNNMSLCLSDGCRIPDTSWIKPGQVCWEWWNGCNVYGPDVDFVAGCNTETYKYFIDFAAKHNVPYMLLDGGWLNNVDPYHSNPTLDLKSVIAYAKNKEVGILLWLPWEAVSNHPEIFSVYEQWGIKGVKVDFMDRRDQWMVNFYEKTARLAAEHHLVVDFHGAYKPSGLEYLYPNVLSYEGVLGMEQDHCYPDNTVWLPFIRNAVGPMDFTPGAMTSMQPSLYNAPDRPNNASIGTRAYQMALYVIFESGVQMLSDSPTQYNFFPDCTDFIASVPVVWDETKVLAAKAGEYLVVAKRSGRKWFIGGITNNSEKNRMVSLNLDFLNAGRTYTIEAFSDGPNSNYQAMDYRHDTTEVSSDDSITVEFAANGGIAAVIY